MGVHRTAAMIIMKMRCTRDQSFTQVGYGLAFGRFLMDAVFHIIWIVGIVDYLWPLWDPKH